MIRATVTAAFLCLLLAPAAMAGNGITVRWFSQQYSQSRAGTGARIDVHRRSAARPPQEPQPIARVAVDVSTGATVKTIGGAMNGSLPAFRYPALPTSSPIFKNPQPAGPGSFWYQDGAGHACMYAPNSVLPCFTVTGAGNGGPAAAPLTPATIAAHVAERLTLSPGQVKASPSTAGLTGAASWFWLDPAPTTEQLSLSLAGEAVTVTAVPRITWQFGDGASVDGGPGVPYQPSSVPPDAITHVYDTRCLPGDQGHDPYVLQSCGRDGYQLTATVSWQISYRAAGPVAATGTLPTRTTTSSDAYAVSEARAFLVGGAAG
ncbi:MAG: hypothetical protein ACREU5_04615 [Burkholderiales bacterium]